MGSHSVTCHPHPAWHYVLRTGLTAHRRWGEVCCLRLRRCVVVRCSTTSWVVVARQSVMQSVAVADCCRRQPALRPTISAPGISLSLPLSLSVCVSVSSWHTVLEHICVHNQAPVFSRGCLLRCLGRTNVQWSQIPFSGSEPRVVGSAKFFNTVYVCTVCYCLAACWHNTG